MRGSRLLGSAACAAVLFLVPPPVRATDSDGDGMSDAYEAFFGLSPADPADALQDPDGDGLHNRAESAAWTDPFQGDTDRDGWSDSGDTDPLSRTWLDWGNLQFTQGNTYDYPGPAWFLGAGKSGGVWTNGCWFSGLNTSAGAGLYVDVDRSILTNDLLVELTLKGAAGSVLKLDLLTSSGAVRATNVLGNLVRSAGRTETRTWLVPLQTWPDATRIRLRRTAGRVRVYEALLYVDQDGDGLDAAQEAQIKTSDLSADSDGDGMGDRWEAENGTDPAQDDGGEDPDQDGFPNLIECELDTDPQDAASRPTLADRWEQVAGYWPLQTHGREVLRGWFEGRLRNGAAFADGAVRLDGGNDYVNFGNHPLLSMKGSFSCCLWVQSGQTNGMLQRLLGKFRTSGDEREYALFYLGNRLHVFLSADGTAQAGQTILKCTAGPSLAGTNWQHVAVTWEASEGAAGLRSYRDGEEEILAALAAGEIGSLHGGTADLTLGCYDVRPRTGGGWQIWPRSREIVVNPFRGGVCQMVLWRAALTEREVREICRLGPDGDLAGYLQTDFDEDGLPDWWERRYWGDVSHAPDEDADGDGLTNGGEHGAGTNPVNVDTDGDGFSDGMETRYGSNPLDPKSDPSGVVPPRDDDGDGLPDWWEERWFGNLTPLPGDDPDGDGWNNLTEYRRGGNPTAKWIPANGDALRLRVLTPTE